MNTYSVMLVDDEEDVIQAIIRKIDWESIGFTVAGYAENSLDALELADKEAPDVVMTDIRMPYMDGLQLAGELKKRFPTIKIIIFSGFDEFEYAHEAIRLEAEEYILKPIDADELTAVFRRLHDSLDRETSEKRDVEKLRKYYMESLPLLRENVYSSLIEGIIREKSIDTYLKDYQIDLTGPHFAVAVIHTANEHDPEGPGPLLLGISVRKLAEERFSPAWRAKFFSYLGNTVLILQMDSPDALPELTDEGDRFCRLAKHVCGATVTVGIGRVCSSVINLPEAYQGARDAVSYRILYGAGRAISITEISPHQHELPAIGEEDLIRDVLKTVKMNDQSALKEAVAGYITAVGKRSSSLQEYHYFIMNLVSELFRFTIHNQLNPDEVLGDSDVLYRRIQQMEIPKLEEWLYEVCIRMQEEIRDQRDSATRSFTFRATEYVQDNYSDQNLNIDKICSVLGVSAAYFSTVFKKQTGQTFINYLTDYRMERAVRLLLETEEKTYVIAEQVGYSDSNYFSYAFKKKYGVSPTVYRRRKKEEAKSEGTGNS
jgi:two-component system response regulator YesN